jgi:predicted NAD/FAD-binding protein
VIDDGIAVHYSELARGTPVFSSDEVQVGTVDEVRDLPREHLLDGIVVKTTAGERRFVDAPEVARTAERAVTLTIPASEMEQQALESSRLAPTRLTRLFGRKR